jgi:hypothetical protein
MTNVHYFPRYSQKENFATNNTLLLFHRLYDASRHRFHRFLQLLVEDEEVSRLGLQLSQQSGTGASIIDGFLFQDAVRIGVEAKLHANAFDEDQLRRHLSKFRKGKEKNFLILLSPTAPALDGKMWQSLKAECVEKGVEPVPQTFSGIIDCFREALRDSDGDLRELVADFEEFCSASKLLDNDATTLFVPPCGKSLAINVAQRLYFCPDTWPRRVTGYVGFYKDKAVRHVGDLAKVVHAELDDNKIHSTLPNGKTVALSAGENQRILTAIVDAATGLGWDITSGNKFFLCGELRTTEFAKQSPGGIMGHRYFDLKQYGKARNLDEVAASLSGQRWD